VEGGECRVPSARVWGAALATESGEDTSKGWYRTAAPWVYLVEGMGWWRRTTVCTLGLGEGERGGKTSEIWVPLCMQERSVALLFDWSRRLPPLPLLPQAALVLTVEPMSELCNDEEALLTSCKGPLKAVLQTVEFAISLCKRNRCAWVGGGGVGAGEQLKHQPLPFKLTDAPPSRAPVPAPVSHGCPIAPPHSTPAGFEQQPAVPGWRLGAERQCQTVVRGAGQAGDRPEERERRHWASYRTQDGADPCQC
jgi:hypothetical protein